VTALVNILAIITIAESGALNSCLEALTVLLLAFGFLAVAASGMDGLFTRGGDLEFRLEGKRVFLLSSEEEILPEEIVVVVIFAGRSAAAVLSAFTSVGETLAVEHNAPRLGAVASDFLLNFLFAFLVLEEVRVFVYVVLLHQESRQTLFLRGLVGV